MGSQSLLLVARYIYLGTKSLLLVARYICVGSLLVARYALLFINMNPQVHRETEFINRLRGRTYVHCKL